MIERRHELRAVLVQRKRMPKRAYPIIALRERQRPAHQHARARDRVPHAQKLDVDRAAETRLEARGLRHARRARARVELVGERHLLDVIAREEPHFREHAGEGACGVGAAGEAEEADLVADAVVRHEELVATHDVRVEVPDEERILS